MEKALLQLPIKRQRISMVPLIVPDMIVVQLLLYDLKEILQKGQEGSAVLDVLSVH